MVDQSNPLAAIMMQLASTPTDASEGRRSQSPSKTRSSRSSKTTTSPKHQSKYDSSALPQSRDDVETISKDEIGGLTESTRSSRRSRGGGLSVLSTPGKQDQKLDPNSGGDFDITGIAALSPRAAAFSKTRASDGSRGLSPRRAIQLALPPTNKYATSSSPKETKKETSPSSTAAIQAAIAAKSTYLTRKAHRFSSMKKSKPGGSDRSQSTNFLLTRLFCSPLEMNQGNEKIGTSSSLLLPRSSSPTSTEKFDRLVRHRQESHSVVKKILELSSTPRNENSEGYNRTSAEKASLHKKSQENHHRKRNFPSPTSHTKEKLNFHQDSPILQDSSFSSSFTNALQLASEKLSLETEIQVRKSMKGTIQDVLLDACANTSGANVTKTHHSPPTYSATTKESADADEDFGSSSSGSRHSNHFTLGQNHNLQGRETKEANEESTEIELKESLVGEEKGTGLSLLTDDENLQGCGSVSPTRFGQSMSPSETTAGAVRSPDENKNADDARRKVPGKLVIPPRFLSSLNAAVPDQIYTKSSSSSSSSSEKISSRDWASQSRESTNFGATVMKSAMEVLKREGRNAEKDEREVASLFGVTRVEMVRASRGFSPPPMVRLTSSLEDLATVPEASTSKETATVVSKPSLTDTKGSFDHYSSVGGSHDDDDEVIVFDSVHNGQNQSAFQSMASPRVELNIRQYTQDELDNHIADAIKKAKREWQNDIFGNYPETLIEVEKQNLKDEYERKIKEQKDQIALANRLAKVRLEEIERLESELENRKEGTSPGMQISISNKITDENNDDNQSEIIKVKQELEQVRAMLDAKEKADLSSTMHEAEFDRLKKEHERVKAQLQAKDLEAISNANAQKKIQAELIEVRTKLAEKEKEVNMKARGELNRVRKELLEVKETLALKEKETRAKTPSKEIVRLQKELNAVKKELAEKETELSTRALSEHIKDELELVRKELQESKRGNIASQQPESDQSSESNGSNVPASSKLVHELEKANLALKEKEQELEQLKKEVIAYKNSPVSGRRGRMMKTPNRRSRSQLPPGSPKVDESCDGQPEIYQKEKENLMKEIELLNQQAIKTSQEHERALQELREASEREIQLVKMDMESRLAHRLDKERSLKQSISHVSPKEKEELLVQIQRLEDEKRNERHGGLREVQRKEELLQRISQLEKKQKEEAEDYERAMQDLRLTSEAEIQRLKQEIRQREEDQVLRERELQNAISDTSSYEKEELLERIDKLQNQLESERNGAVLLKIKLANVEKNNVATKKSHEAYVEKIQTEKDFEIQCLRTELDSKASLEAVVTQLTESEKVYKMTIEKLEREKHFQLQQLKEQLTERTRVEESFKAISGGAEEQQSYIKHLEEEKEKVQQKLDETLDEKSSIEQALRVICIEKQVLERELISSEKLHSEALNALKMEKDKEIQDLRHAIDSNKEIIDKIPYSENNEHLRKEIEILTKKLDAEQVRRQRIIDEIKQEHSRNLGQVKQTSAEKIRQLQQEADESLQKSQKELEKKYQILLAQSNDKVVYLENQLSSKKEHFENEIKAAEIKFMQSTEALREQLKNLQEQLDSNARQTEEEKAFVHKHLDEKEESFNRRLQEVEQNFFSEKRRLQEEIRILTQKRDQMEARMEEKLKKDMKAYEQKFSFERKKLYNQIEAMKSQQKEGEKTVESQLQEKEKEGHEKILLVEKRFSLEKEELLKEIEAERKLRIEDRTKMETELQRQLSAAEENFVHEKRLLEQQAATERSNLEAKHKQIIQEQETKAADLSNHIKSLEEKLANFEVSIDAEVQKEMKEFEEQHVIEKKALLDQIDQLVIEKTETESRIKNIQKEHTKELDELLSQLDLVEAEHQDLINQKEQVIADKEGIISALGGQMAETQRRMNSLEQKLVEQYDIVERAQLKSKTTEEALAACKKELQAAKDAHHQFTLEAEILRAKACEEAREEMIERAETQFQQANEHYIKLRKQFDSAQSHIVKLESRIKDTVRKLDIATKEKDSCEINLKAEIAQLKAARAKIEADAAQMTREYRRELDRLTQTAKDYEAKLLESETTSRNIQTTLATVVAEKEKLKREYEDMKNVSEELMAIVEGQQKRE